MKAKADDVNAQGDLGKKAFQNGNMVDGVKWATKAAEQGMSVRNMEWPCFTPKVMASRKIRWKQ